MELKTLFAQDLSGNALRLATCRLYHQGTDTLVSGLQDSTGAALGNPWTTDARGLVQFAAPNGLYDLRVTFGARDYSVRVQCLDVAEQIAAVQADASRAEVARDAATASAEGATDSKNASIESANAANLAKAAAEAAAESARLSSGVFPDTASGLAATTSGNYFSVLSPNSSEYIILYLNSTGTAVEQRRYPATGMIVALQEDLQAESEARATADGTVLSAAKEYIDETIRQSDDELKQVSGIDYGTPLLALLSELGLSPLLLNTLGEIAIPYLLAGELISGVDRGLQCNYSFAIADDDNNVLVGSRDNEWLWPSAGLIADLTAAFQAADTSTLSAAKAYTDNTGIANFAEPVVQTAGTSFGTPVLPFLDEKGLAALLINIFGETAIPYLLAGELISTEDRGFQYNYSFALVDDDNNVLLGELDNQLLLPTSFNQTVDTTAGELEAYAASLPVGPLANDTYTSPIWDYNHVIGNSQSLGWGSEAWPSLSKTARLGNLMLGDSVRPVSEIGTTFAPVGGAAFKPLVATVRNQSTGGLLTDAEVAALPQDSTSQNAGETPIEALCNGLKRGLNDRLMVANDARSFVASVCGVPGRTIEQLSKGADPHLYNRYLACLSTSKSLADGQGKTYGVAVIALLQGEYNYRPDWGGTTNEAAYKAKWLQWVDDHAADAKAITGQTREPLFLTYQTSGAWTRDTDNLSIGMAQWRATKERKNLFLAAPAYPVTDKNGHLDSNGSRWLGYQMAKAAIWASVHRRRWRPLEPVQIRQVGKAIYVAYHVPHPPLRWADIYMSGTAQMYAAKGFRVQDSSGFMAISNVEIVSPHVVKISLASEPTGTTYVWYADYTVHAGNGNLADSDPTLADDFYEYLPDSGMYASANIPALVNKPYPLANFSIAFRLPAGFTE